MIQRIRKLAPFTIIVLVAMLTLAACGGTPADQPGDGDTGSGDADKPTRLVIGAPSDIQHFDIHNHNYTYTEAVHINMFDYLVRYNLDTAEFEPMLATEWELVEPTVWEFKLREGVKFHNGEDFEASDVKFTLERVSRDESLKEYNSNRTIKEVQIVDDYNIRIVTHQPDPLLLFRLSRIGSGMLPADYWAEVGGVDEFQKAPVGTGAWEYVEWIKDDSLTLKANENYWRGQPPFDELVFRVIPETATRVAELQTGGIDIALGVGVDDIPMLENNDDLTVKALQTLRVYLMIVNRHEGMKTADPRVREAIDLAIDNQALIDGILPGMGAVPVRTRLIKGIGGGNEDLYDTYLYDPDRAKELLAEAGYEDGIEIGLLSRNSGIYSQLSQTIISQLEKVGFTVNPQDIIDPAAYSQRFNADELPEITVLSYGNSMKHADLAVGFAISKSWQERINYIDEEVIELVNQAATEMDKDKADALYKEISQRYADDRAQIYLFREAEAHAARADLNWEPTADEMLWVFDMSIKGE